MKDHIIAGKAIKQLQNELIELEAEITHLRLTEAERRAITALLDRLRVNDEIDVELSTILKGLLKRYSDDSSA